MTRRPPVALAVLAAFVAAPAARAADWSFDPSVVLGLQYNDNVLFVGDPSDPETLGDFIGVFSVLLPLTATTPRSSTSFSVMPTRYQYASKEYTGSAPGVPGGANLSDLSYSSYAATLTWTFNQSPRTTWEASTSGSRTDRQTISFETVQQDLLLLPPTTSTYWAASGSGTFRLSERASWIVNVGSSGTIYDADVIEDPLTEEVISVDNTTTTTFGLASESRLSPRSRLEVGYLGQYIDNGRLGSDLVQNLWGGYVYGEATEGWQFSGRVGAAWLKTANVGTVPEPLQDEITPVFQLAVSRNVIRRSVVEIGASQMYSGTSGAEGTALVRGAYTGLRVPIKEYSRFGLAVHYSDRRPTLPEFSDSQTLGGNVEYVAGLSPRWALGFGAQYYEQTSEDTGTTSVPDGTYSIFSAVISWSPNNR